MIKVIQIQYSTHSGGSSALRLQKAFIKANIQSRIISLERDKQDIENITYLGKKQRFFARLYTKIQTYLTRKGAKEYGLFSCQIGGINVSQLREIREADYIYVHWTQNGFVNPKNIIQLAQLNKPVIVVMHDMWSITGGCHYSFECTKYKQDCSDCPIFSEKKMKYLAEKYHQKKLSLYNNNNNIYFVSPSKWLYNCAKESTIARNKPVFYIPNVLDTALFKPFDKSIAKYIFNISDSSTVIAFGAVSIDNYRKGWRYFQQALVALKRDTNLTDVIVLIFGSDYNTEIAGAIPFPTKFLGYLGDEYSTSLAYNAANVFVVPSLADNQPTTIQESLSCGTSVVGFDIGGIADMIEHKQNGYLAKYKDVEDLAAGINFCLTNNVKGKMLSNFETGKTIQKHEELFEYIKNNKR